MKYFFLEPKMNEGYFITENNPNIKALFTSGISQCVGVSIEGYVQSTYKITKSENFYKAIYLVHINGVFNDVEESIKLKIQEFLEKSINFFSKNHKTNIYIISKNMDPTVPEYKMKKIVLNNLIKICKNQDRPWSLLEEKAAQCGIYFENNNIEYSFDTNTIYNKFSRPDESFFVDFKIAMWDKKNNEIAEFDKSDCDIEIIETRFNKYNLGVVKYNTKELFFKEIINRYPTGSLSLNFSKKIPFNYENFNELKNNLYYLQENITFDLIYSFDDEETFFNIEDLNKAVNENNDKQIESIKFSISIYKVFEDLTINDKILSMDRELQIISEKFDSFDNTYSNHNNSFMKIEYMDKIEGDKKAHLLVVGLTILLVYYFPII